MVLAPDLPAEFFAEEQQLENLTTHFGRQEPLPGVDDAFAERHGDKTLGYVHALGVRAAWRA